MAKFVSHFLNDESGATAIEYALIITGIAVVIVTAVGLLGGTVRGLFQDAVDMFPT